jgi:hypothetical protein
VIEAFLDLASRPQAMAMVATEADHQVPVKAAHRVVVEARRQLVVRRLIRAVAHLFLPELPGQERRWVPVV